MVKRKRLFHTGGALPDQAPYVPREADATASDELLHGLLFLSAPRQTGKTSLLLRLMKTLQSKWMCCYVDLSTLTNFTDPSTWYFLLARKISADCGVPPSRAVTDQKVLEEFLLEDVGIKADPAARLVVIFDEIEGLEALGFSDPFLSELRYLFQFRGEFQGRLRIALAGSVDPRRLIKNSKISPFNVVRKTVKLDDFSFQESFRLTRRLGDLGAAVDGGVYAHIFHWTRGHPHLTHRICQLIEERVLSGESPVCEEWVDDIVENQVLADDPGDSNVAHVLDKTRELGPEAKAVLARICAGERLPSSAPGCDELRYIGVVVPDANNELKIRNPIYERALSG